VVGGLASRGADRTALRTVGLRAWAGVGLGQALALGVVPFLVGDVIKIALAAGLLPVTWRPVRRTEQDEQ